MLDDRCCRDVGDAELLNMPVPDSDAEDLLDDGNSCSDGNMYKKASLTQYRSASLAKRMHGINFEHETYITSDIEAYLDTISRKAFACTAIDRRKTSFEQMNSRRVDGEGVARSNTPAAGVAKGTVAEARALPPAADATLNRTTFDTDDVDIWDVLE